MKVNVEGDVVGDWREDERGKSVKVKGKEMGEMESMCGEVLGMERGKRREKEDVWGME